MKMFHVTIHYKEMELDDSDRSSSAVRHDVPFNVSEAKPFGDCDKIIEAPTLKLKDFCNVKYDPWAFVVPGGKNNIVRHIIAQLLDVRKPTDRGIKVFHYPAVNGPLHYDRTFGKYYGARMITELTETGGKILDLQPYFRPLASRSLMQCGRRCQILAYDMKTKLVLIRGPYDTVAYASDTFLNEDFYKTGGDHYLTFSIFVDKISFLREGGHPRSTNPYARFGAPMYAYVEEVNCMFVNGGYQYHFVCNMSSLLVRAYFISNEAHNVWPGDRICIDGPLNVSIDTKYDVKKLVDKRVVSSHTFLHATGRYAVADDVWPLPQAGLRHFCPLARHRGEENVVCHHDISRQLSDRHLYFNSDTAPVLDFLSLGDRFRLACTSRTWYMRIWNRKTKREVIAALEKYGIFCSLKWYFDNGCCSDDFWTRSRITKWLNIYAHKRAISDKWRLDRYTMRELWRFTDAQINTVPFMKRTFNNAPCNY
jgi:hypothetical protein